MKTNPGWIPPAATFAGIAVVFIQLLSGCSTVDYPTSPTASPSGQTEGIAGVSQPVGVNGATQSLQVENPQERSSYMPNEVLVVLHDEAEAAWGPGFFDELPVRVIASSALRWGTIYKLEITDDSTVEGMSDLIGSDPEVRFAQPNYLRYVQETPYWPNDPMWESGDPGEDPRDNTYEQWGPSKLGASIVWNDSNGDGDIVVAIIDSGILYDHEDLHDVLWMNEDEDPANGIDDDGNGYIDDWWGWNCWQMNNDPNDDGAYCSFHGTGCSGVVAGVQDNEIGLSGIAPGVKLMAIKVMFADNYASDYTIMEGLNYAAVNEADICSMSFGGSDVAPGFETAINDAWDNGDGCLLLAAAGNGNTTSPFYPAHYDATISVGATVPFSRWGDPVDERRIQPGWEGWWWGSNYGSTLNVMGFGEKYLTTHGSGTDQYWDGVNHSFFNGTSCACPTAAGVMALIMTFHPGYDGWWYWERLEDTADDLDVPGFDNQTGNGRVNAVRAVYGPDRYSELADILGFVQIPMNGSTPMVEQPLYDTIHDVPDNPYDDPEDLYLIRPSYDGDITIYLDIFSWGEDLDMGLYRDPELTLLIAESTVENHFDSSWETLTAYVFRNTDYFLKIYSPATGNSTTYGLSITME